LATMTDNTILKSRRVLDLTDEKGKFCSGLLSGMGAEVIRIEKPGLEVPPEIYDAGKHRLGLDIESPKGRELFKRLVRTSDVLIESCAPGHLDSVGLGYTQLKKVNPRLIMASVTHFGQAGPYRDFKSSDLVSSALGGQMSVCGEPGKPPLKPFGPQAYLTAGLFAANAVMLALWQRHTSDRGQYIDISIHECVAGTLDHVPVRYFYQREVAERRGSLYWNNAFSIFSCQDGHILLSLNHQWETLVEWLSSEGLAGDLADKKWLDEDERRKNIDHIVEVLEKWTRTHTVNELVETGQLMRFPWAGVDRIPQVVDSPQLNQRGYFVEATDPESGKKYKYPGAPVKMSGSPWQVNSNPFPSGEYNRKIYHDELGLSDEEISSLSREGII
jgi:benzylsuccinate CoA-transferase BbsE subunit